MLKGNSRQLNFYSVLYDRITEDHILKKIDSAVDFSFINEYLEKSYCKYYGRPAIAANLKRIARLLSFLNDQIHLLFKNLAYLSDFQLGLHDV